MALIRVEDFKLEDGALCIPLEFKVSRDRPRTCSTTSMSPRAVVPSRASEPPTGLHHYAAAITLDEIFGNGSAATVNASVNRNMVEPTSGISNQSQTSLSNLVLRLRTPWVITNAKVLMKIPPPDSELRQLVHARRFLPPKSGTTQYSSREGCTASITGGTITERRCFLRCVLLSVLGHTFLPGLNINLPFPHALRHGQRPP